MSGVNSMESCQDGAGQFTPPKAFRGIHLFTVRIPGIRMLARYADYDVANDWFERGVGFGS